MPRTAGQTPATSNAVERYVLRAFKVGAAACIGAALTGCAALGQPETQTVGTADLIASDGTSAGQAVLRYGGADLVLTVSASGIAPGAHGFHFHQTGRCDTPDFTTAGGHLNPSGAEHGTMNPDGSHLGDLPNLEIGANGTITTDINLTMLRPRDRDTLLASLFDADGTAIMIHAGPDDYRTDPSGDAGSRIACGVLTRTP